MATENPTQRGPKTVKIKRFQIGLNVLIQVGILVMILGMVNYVAFNHYKRWDYTRNQKYALSEKTKNVLRSLKKQTTAIVFFATGSDISGDLERLLREYQFASNKKLTVEFVDTYRNLARARELQSKYKFGAQENIVILDYDGRTKFINATDMADYDNSGAMFGQPPLLKAFKGEQAITGGLLEISEEKQYKLYTLTGQGEREISEEDLRGIKTFIERENIKIDTLNLQNVDAVPQDAKALLVIGARYDFSEREIKLLKDYWEKNGRLFILLDPNVPMPRLTAFLADQGVKPQDDRILRTMKLAPGVTGLLREVTGVFVEGSPVTKRLKDVNGLFIGATQSLWPDHQRAQSQNIRLTPLVRASEGYWGETEYNIHEGDSVYFDAKTDHPAPLIIVISVEKGALSDSRVQVESSRMIVAGNSEFISNKSLSDANANLDFALAGIDWLLDREELIGIAPKVNKTFALNLTDAQVGNILVLAVGVIPGIAALLGIFTWWRRRR
jgi:hypothetical protein